MTARDWDSRSLSELVEFWISELKRTGVGASERVDLQKILPRIKALEEGNRLELFKRVAGKLRMGVNQTKTIHDFQIGDDWIGYRQNAFDNLLSYAKESLADLDKAITEAEGK